MRPVGIPHGERTDALIASRLTETPSAGTPDDPLTPTRDVD